MKSFGPLVSADWLRAHLSDPGLRVIDFRWYMDGRSGPEAYRRGHIPGAVFVDLDGEVTGKRPGAGRHPLPERDAFERVMRVAGVNAGDTVVVYDDMAGYSAARMWWMLRHFGVDRAAVLDGGMPAWGEPLEEEEVHPREGDFTATDPEPGAALSYEEMRSIGPDRLLIDARAAERFRGDEEPVDPRPGHIPGARNAPWQGNVDAEGRFRDPAELRERFSGVGVDDPERVVVYCGSGVTACHDLLALELAGLGGARLYPGSWSEWSGHPDAPAAVGEGE